jgi:SAM-dependent methyltransferase
MLNGDTFSESYRVNHQSADIVADYVSTFEVGYCAALWRKVEQPLLERILRPLGGSERTTLDFACGTGRITKVAALFYGSVVGVDVSEAMLLAASVPNNVTLLCIDITKVPLEQTLASASQTVSGPAQRCRSTRRRDGHIGGLSYCG